MEATNTQHDGGDKNNNLKPIPKNKTQEPSKNLQLPQNNTKLTSTKSIPNPYNNVSSLFGCASDELKK